MQKINLDAVDPAVKKFIRSLPPDPDGVELLLEGDVVCKVVGPHQVTESAKEALFERGREIVRLARQRNTGVPAKVIEREVQAAVDEVRRQKRQ